MPEYRSPEVYVEEIPSGVRPIERVATDVAGFVGVAEAGPAAPQRITGWREFREAYGGHIDESYLARAVEPNDEPLWASLTRSIDAFLDGLWRDGALQGAKPDEAFFVRCDRTTMTESDIAEGRLVWLVGFAPLKPAEFVTLRMETALRS